MIYDFLYGPLFAICTLVSSYFIFIFVYLPTALAFSDEYNMNISNMIKDCVYKKYVGESFTAKKIESIILLWGNFRFIKFISEKNLIQICSGISRLDENEIYEDVQKIHTLGKNKYSRCLNRLSATVKPFGFSRLFFKSILWSYRCDLLIRMILYIGSKILPPFLDRCGRYITITAIISVITGYFIWVGRGEVELSDADILVNLNLNILSYGALISVCTATLIEIIIQLISKKFYRISIFLMIFIMIIPVILVILEINYFEVVQNT